MFSSELIESNAVGDSELQRACPCPEGRVG